MRVIHHDGRTGTVKHPAPHPLDLRFVQWDDGDSGWHSGYNFRPLGPIEAELLRADPRYSMAAQLRAESCDRWVCAGGLAGSLYDRSERLSEANEAARWLEDPEGNAAELARAREMGAIR
jgi:hypothetical protein